MSKTKALILLGAVLLLADLLLFLGEIYLFLNTDDIKLFILRLFSSNGLQAYFKTWYLYKERLFFAYFESGAIKYGVLGALSGLGYKSVFVLAGLSTDWVQKRISFYGKRLSYVALLHLRRLN